MLNEMRGQSLDEMYIHAKYYCKDKFSKTKDDAPLSQQEKL